MHGGQSRTTRVKKAHFQLSGRNQRTNITLHALSGPTVCAPPKRVAVDLKKYPRLKGLPLADTDPRSGASINILIGADQWSQIMKGGIKKRNSSSPMALNSVFGWLLSCPAGIEQSNTGKASTHHATTKILEDDRRSLKMIVFEAYKAKRSRINKIIKSAKYNYSKREIDLNKSNPKENVKQINQVISGKGRRSKTTTLTTIKNYQGNLIQGEKLIADEFNEYFAELGPKLSSQITNSSSSCLDYLTPVNCELHFAVINNNTILNKISKIKFNKALGLDKISGKLLKVTATVVTPFLNLIFNSSLAEGIFPSDWKNARVSPICQSGNRDECSNYRPISVLSTISKIFLNI